MIDIPAFNMTDSPRQNLTNSLPLNFTCPKLPKPEELPDSFESPEEPVSVAPEEIQPSCSAFAIADAISAAETLFTFVLEGSLRLRSTTLNFFTLKTILRILIRQEQNTLAKTGG